MSYFTDFSLLRRNRDYRLLYLGQCVSFFGTMITGVALPYQIYQLTHSTLMVGLLGLVQLLPLLVTALLGGVFADRYPRKRLLIGTELLLMIACLSLTFNALLATPQLWLIYLIAALMSGITGLHRPALESITQQVVAKKDLAAVGALSSFKFGVCAIGGPAFSGFVIVKLGIVVTYLVDFASFIISLIALLLISKIPIQSINQHESTWQSLKGGIRYAWSRQELVGTYTIDFMAMIFGMPTALFPAIAHASGNASLLGLLYASPAVGALAISFFSGWTKYIKRHGVAIAISACLWGVAIILFGLAANIWVGLFFLALAGAFDAISGVFRSILWNETIPTHYRGRLAGIEMLSYLSGPKLGDTEAGFVAALFGVTASIVSGGVLCVASVAICCYFLPKFWQYRSQLPAENSTEPAREVTKS